jgi:hypothetical protein
LLLDVDQSFTVKTDNLILNENFLPDNYCKNLIFNDQILESSVKIEKEEKLYQFTSFHVIENNVNLRNQVME